MAGSLSHEYRKFLVNCYTLRRILRETQHLLEDLEASSILPHVEEQPSSSLQPLHESLHRPPALVMVGPCCSGVLEAHLGPIELPEEMANCKILRIFHSSSILPPLDHSARVDEEAPEIHELQLPHPLLKKGLQVLVAPHWGSLHLKPMLSVILYGVSKPQLSQQELKDLVNLRFDWPDVPLCFVCLDSLGDDHLTLTDICQQLESVGFLPGPGIGVERVSGVAGFVRCCLQAHLVKVSLQLNDIQSQYLRNFILSAFDMARELQITPRRLQYAQEKEAELHGALMRVASEKQAEITLLIENTLQEMRSSLLDKAAESEAEEFFTNPSAGVEAIRTATQEVQQLVLGRLSRSVASQLVRSVDCLQHSYVGTLQRCLESLERHCQDTEQNSLMATDALRQSLSAAYCVELSACPTTLLASLIDRLRKMLRGLSLPWTATPQLDAGWRRRVAADILDSLSAARLARSICSQFRERVRTSHEAFQEALRSLENRLSGRLERTEEQRVAIRKQHAPRLARLALESTSMCDMVRYGMPQLGKEIGRGQYGVVFACDSWGGVGPCAVKSVVPPDDKHWNDLAMEFYYTRTLPEHRRIVRVRGSVVDVSYGGGCSPAVLLVMDRLSRDLYCGLRAGMPWLGRLQVAIDVVEGVRFLHAQGLVHRDIKLKNVLLDERNRAKLTDLGFCIPEAMMSGSIVGTPIHMAPELLSGHYDSSVDVYALGILLWYLCAGHVRLPYVFEQFHSKEQLWTSVIKGLRPERLPHFDEQCWQLMEQCWAAEPAQRPLLGYVQPRLEAVMRKYHAVETSSPLCSDPSDPEPANLFSAGLGAADLVDDLAYQT